MDGNFLKKFFLGDEVNFTLGGYVNKQNCRIWVSENPPLIEERTLHLQKLTQRIKIIKTYYRNGDGR